MAGSAKLAALFAAAAFTTFGASITFKGPFGPGNDSGVNGPQLIFDLQDAILQQPTTPNGPWKLTVDTNYGTPLPGDPGNIIPSFTLDSLSYSMSDFLIQQGTNYYGIILHAHDGYIAGDLYSGPGFQNAPHFNTTRPVFLAPGGTLIGTGILSAAPNPGGNGITVAEYKITVSFNAPSTFLGMNAFVIDMSSADCANGFMTYSAAFGGDGVAAVPEPGTLVLTGSALLLCWRVARRKTARSLPADTKWLGRRFRLPIRLA